MIKATDATTHGLPRPVLAAIALAVLATLASACQRSDATQAATSPTQATAATTTPARPPPTAPSPTPTPTPPTTPSPTPDPTDTADATGEADLEQLRASRQFLEFAEADRARHATWARFAYDRFAPHADGQILFEWANKDELWNSIAPRVRDQCLLAGREATRPMWNAQIVIPASLNPTWNNETTYDRGHFIDFVCRYQDEVGELSALWFGALVAISDDGFGAFLTLSPSVHIGEADYEHLEEANEGARRQLWRWIERQPRRGHTGA